MGTNDVTEVASNRRVVASTRSDHGLLHLRTSYEHLSELNYYYYYYYYLIPPST